MNTSTKKMSSDFYFNLEITMDDLKTVDTTPSTQDLCDKKLQKLEELQKKKEEELRILIDKCICMNKQTFMIHLENIETYYNSMHQLVIKQKI